MSYQQSAPPNPGGADALYRFSGNRKITLILLNIEDNARRTVRAVLVRVTAVK